MFRKKVLLASLFVLLVATFCVSPVFAWEVPQVVAGTAGNSYFKPEIGFAPTGAVYIVYREKLAGTGNSDIMMCAYDGKQMVYHNVSNAGTVWPRFKCYESDIECTADGRVHVAWVTHNRNATGVHYIKYRYLDTDGTWSDIVNLGDLHVHSGDFVFDLRLGVDNSGNVHVLLQEDEQCVIRYFAKYGDTILPMENIGNGGSRLKHPDIAVDDNYIHMIWMRKIGYPYVIVYQKRENKIGGAKGNIRQITFPKGDYASQKSRIDLDSEGYLHLAEFYKTGIVKKLKYYKELPNGSFTPYVNLSSPEKLMLYHWAGLEVRDNSIIATMQLGSTSGGNGIYRNWNKNGVWGGYTFIDGTNGAVHQSVDLSLDGQIAAVTYARAENAIMMVSSEPITATSMLEAEFTHPQTVFYGDSVVFDASQVPGLNPDTTIVQYDWEFGDGTSATTVAPTATHIFNTYGNEVTVKLTITNVDGYTGSVEKTLTIKALYTALLGTITSKSIRTLFYNKPANQVTWSPNPKNVNAGFPTITKFELWRAPVSSSMSQGDYVFVAEVGASQNTYLDYKNVSANSSYTYVILSVDEQGHKSPFDNL